MTGDEDRGRFVWFDLMTTDPPGAIDFYTKLLGWGTHEWEKADIDYTMWANGEDPLGGVVELSAEAREAGAPPHWLSYVAVPDVDATLERAQEIGGTVLYPATDIPSAGRFAVIQDPQGAMIAVYRSVTVDSAPQEPSKVGEFSWHELATSDQSAAYDFYAEIFGWEKQQSMDMGDGWIYQIYGRNNIPFGGIFNKPAEMEGPPTWLHYIKVDNVDSAVDRVKELGGQLLNGPMEVPGGDKIAQCLDPQGAAFALHSSARSS